MSLGCQFFAALSAGSAPRQRGEALTPQAAPGDPWRHGGRCHVCTHCPNSLHFCCTLFSEDCPFCFAFFYLLSPLTPRKGRYNGFYIPHNFTFHSRSKSCFFSRNLYLWWLLWRACVWQNVLEKLGSGNGELQRDCRSAGRASCLIRALERGLSYVQGCVYLLFSVHCVHALLALQGQWLWSCTAARGREACRCCGVYLEGEKVKGERLLLVTTSDSS